MAKKAAKKKTAKKAPAKKVAKKKAEKKVAKKVVKKTAKKVAKKAPAKKVTKKAPATAAKKAKKVTAKPESAPVVDEAPVKKAKPVKVPKPKKISKKQQKINEEISELIRKWAALQRKHGQVPAKEYKMTDMFEAKTPIMHKVHGWGFVMTNINDRLEVLFESGIKLLISNYKS